MTTDLVTKANDHAKDAFDLIFMRQAFAWRDAYTPLTCASELSKALVTFSKAKNEACISIWTLLAAVKGLREYMTARVEAGSQFYTSLRNYVSHSHRLTPKQAVAVLNDFIRDGAVVKASSVPRMDASVMFEAFENARLGGLINRKLRIGEWLFKSKGLDHQTIYAYHDSLYVGRIREGRFDLSEKSTISKSNLRDLEAILKDPLTFAQVHGHQTGHCGVCSRLLTDPVSVKQGIGPVCATRFFGKRKK